MPDYGDEFGSQMTSTAQSILQTWLMRGGYREAKSMMQDDVEYMGMPFEIPAEMNAAYSMMREYGIDCHKDIAEDGVLTLMIKKNDIQKAERVLEQVRKETSEKIVKKQLPTHDANTELRNIKSHDSMDINFNTKGAKYGDLDQYEMQWKKELIKTIKEARVNAHDEQDFINHLSVHGVKTIDAKDGEVLFIHPSCEWLKLRGDTIDKEEGVSLYSRKSFKDKGYDLESEAKDARVASKILAEEAVKDAPDRFIEAYQQLTK